MARTLSTSRCRAGRSGIGALCEVEPLTHVVDEFAVEAVPASHDGELEAVPYNVVPGALAGRAAGGAEMKELFVLLNLESVRAGDVELEEVVGLLVETGESESRGSLRIGGVGSDREDLSGVELGVEEAGIAGAQFASERVGLSIAELVVAPDGSEASGGKRKSLLPVGVGVWVVG